MEERALRRGGTWSQAGRVSPKVLAWLGVIGAVVLGVVIVNVYLKGHQTLHIVNGWSVPVKVSIDGGSAEDVPARTRHAVPIAEGRHRAVVTRAGAPEEAIEFDVCNTFFQRVFSKSVFVLNPGGAATLLWQEIVYGDESARPEYRLRYGKSYLIYRDINYVFEEAPDEITTESSKETRHQVATFFGAPSAIVDEFPAKGRPGTQLGFCEHHLKLTPGDTDLLDAYAAIAGQCDESVRCLKFLSKGLARRPVIMPWHRAYQDMCVVGKKTGGLAAEYDKMLKAEPDSSPLLYLRGRLEPTITGAAGYYDRSIAADDKNPFPLAGKGFLLLARCEFTAARDLLTKAAGLGLDSARVRHLLFEARFASGDHVALEAETAAALVKSPLGFALHRRLLALLAVQGKLNAAATAQKAYAKAIRAEIDDDPYDIVLQSELMWLYLKGDFQTMLKKARSRQDPEARNWLLYSIHLELGDLKRADAALCKAGEEPDPDDCLLMSLGWRQKGDAARAAAWRQKAVESYRGGSLDTKAVAELLKKGDGLTLADVDEIAMAPWDKSIVLTALAAECPSQRSGLLERARKLNYGPLVPHRVLKRFIENMK